MTSRLFVALDLPTNIIDNLVEERDKIYGLPNDIKWEGNDKLHITLQFLGDVGENVSDLLIRQFENIEFNKISTQFSKFSFFKNKDTLKILFAGFQVNPQIIEFQRIIKNECELIGFESVNKKFHPHVTLLRIKGREDIARLSKFNNQDINCESFEIESFSLVKSELHATGSQYSLVKRFNLI